jgi:L-lactate dehydrogenase complex protein LldG
VSARDEILAALRRAAAPTAPRPDLIGLGVRFADPVQTFGESLAAVGGALLRAPDRAVAARALADLPVYRQAGSIASLVAGIGRSDIDLAAVDDPRDLEHLALAVLPGELAVAENGAVWVDGSALPHRTIFVIAEHLVLVVQAADVVHDMHEACARLARRPPRYGTFIAGPSKTADIEQALVVGAHGARTTTVLLIG